MAKLITTARVYDRKTGEYVQRMVEAEISDAVARTLILQMHGAIGHGHGDDDSNLNLKTPLRDQERFHVDPKLDIIVDGDGENEPLTGGWSML